MLPTQRSKHVSELLGTMGNLNSWERSTGYLGPYKRIQIIYLEKHLYPYRS